MIKGLVILITYVFLPFSTYAGIKSICGATDDRVLSYNTKIGRLSVEGEHKGCTVTMISESCGITAGHCYPVLERAEFNTPESRDNLPQPSAFEDVYKIDQSTITYKHEGPGKDWAVFQFKRNEITGKLPGQVQGYYNVSFQKITPNQRVTITGYGKDDGDLIRNFAQQIHDGEIAAVGDAELGPAVLKHQVDTMGGNSGATIINKYTDEVIGIHTHGGCNTEYTYNLGTSINLNNELQQAIKKCLASE